MPRYGDKVYRPADRWAIVNHVRKLQAASPAPQEPAGAAVGIPPGPAPPARPEGGRDEPATVHQRLVERALTGKYELFLGVGGGLADPRSDPLPDGARRRRTPPRAWQLFHVNWLYFTGLAGGSVAFVAVQKITNAKWSGLVIRFAEASVAFLPLSLLGLVLIFTLGYHAVYGPMEAALHGMQHSKEVWLSLAVHVRPAGGRPARCSYWVGWRLIRADLIPDMLATRAVAGAGPPRALRAVDPGLRRHAAGRRGATSERIHRLAPTLRGALRASSSAWWRSTGSWRSSRTGSPTCSAASTSWAPSWAPTCCSALMSIYGAAHLGISDLVSPKQRHDLGKLCFGFTVFWTYLMWAQFLVIWYGNLPEETGFVFARLWGEWLPGRRGGAARDVHHPVLRPARRGAQEDPR